MSVHVGTDKGDLGQFASNHGYHELLTTTEAGDYPVLQDFFEEGITEEVTEAVSQLEALADDTEDTDIASTATGLADLIRGHDVAVIHHGLEVEEEDDEPGKPEPVEHPADWQKPDEGHGEPVEIQKKKNRDELAKAARHFRTEPHFTEAANELTKVFATFLNKAAKHVAAQLRLHPTTKLAKREPPRDLLDRLLRIDWDEIIPAAAAQLRRVAEAAGYQSLVNLDISDEGVISEVNRVAGDWARERAAELVGRKYNASGALENNPDARWAISETTREEIKRIVTEAFQQNTNIGDLADTIEQAGAFSESRAGMIARTEAARAQAQGNLAGWRESGVVEEVDVVLSADHDDAAECDCTDISENGPYELGDAPDVPIHPNCWCTLIARIARPRAEGPGDDEEEDDEV